MIGNQGNRVTRGADAYRRKGVLGWALMCYVCVGIGGYLVTWLLIEKKSIEYQVKYVGAVGNQGWTKWLPLLYQICWKTSANGVGRYAVTCCGGYLCVCCAAPSLGRMDFREQRHGLHWRRNTVAPCRCRSA